MINTTPSKPKFDEYVKLGLVQKKVHPELPLSIYTYTILTNYERLWNNVTKLARGIVYDDKERLIIRGLPKFFNEEEPHAVCEISSKEKPTYFNKLDGSLIQVVNDPEYGLVVTSKGSFASKHAGWAKKILAEKYADAQLIKGYTYVFELIHPDNRIVLDYGKTEDLYLLAVIEINTGDERDIFEPVFSKFKKVGVVTDIEKHMADKSVEGVVVKSGTHRYKMKTGEYVRLHRIVTEFTPKRVWEALSSGSSLEFKDMPEEFQKWLDSTSSKIQLNYDNLIADIQNEYNQTLHMTPKEIGLANDIKFKGFIFSLRNGKDISESAWRLVKPKEGDLND